MLQPAFGASGPGDDPEKEKKKSDMSIMDRLFGQLPDIATPIGNIPVQRFYESFQLGRKQRAAGAALEVGIQPAFGGPRPGPQLGIAAGKYKELRRGNTGGLQGKREPMTPEEIQDASLKEMVDISREIEGHDTGELEQAIAAGDWFGLAKSIAKDPIGTLGEAAAKSFGTGPEGMVLGALGPMGQFMAAYEPEKQIDLAENFKAELENRGQPLTVENLKALMEEPGTVERLREAAGTRGLAVGATEMIFGVGTARVVEKAGTPFAKALLGLVSEAGGESAGEAAGQLTEGRFNPIEIVSEGLLVGPQSLVAAGSELAFDASANSAQPQRPVARFVARLEESGLSREESEAVGTLWAARAAQLGMDVDSFLGATLEGVEKGGDVPAEALRQIPEDMWFSSLEVELRRSGLPNTASNDTYLEIIENLGKKGKFKDDELYWSGLVDFIKLKKDMGEQVDRDELFGLLNYSRVRVSEEVLVESPKDLSEGKSIYERYQVPGGKNYREILLTLPSLQSPRERAADFAGLNAQEGVNENPLYTGGHFGELYDNVVMHMRVDDRTLADGRRALFVQEVQSDPHQGRRQVLQNIFKDAFGDTESEVIDLELKKVFGDKIPTSPEELTAEQAEAFFEKLNEHRPNTYQVWDSVQEGAFRVMTPDQDRVVTAESKGEAVKKVLSLSLPPAMPFEATDSWTSLGLKRLLRYAVDNGYDAVSWSDAASIAKAVGGMEKKLNEHYMRRIPRLVGKISKEKPRLEEFTISGGKIDQKTNLTVQAYLFNFDAPNSTVAQQQALVNRIAKLFTISDEEAYFDFRRALNYALDSYLDGSLSLSETIKEVLVAVPQNEDKRKFGTIDVTPKLKSRVLGGLPLFQGEKGAVSFGEDGKALVQMFEGADVSTALHESAHIWRRGLTPAEQREADIQFGIGEEGWTVEKEELFARSFEQWLATGKTENSSLVGIFRKFKAWLHSIYNGIKGSSIDVKVSPEMSAFFDSLFAEVSTESTFTTGPAQLAFGVGPGRLMQEEDRFLPEGLSADYFDNIPYDEHLLDWYEGVEEQSEEFPRTELFFETLGAPSEREFQEAESSDVPLDMEQEAFLAEVLGIVSLDRRAAVALIRRIGLTADTSQRRKTWLQALAQAHAEGLTAPAHIDGLTASVLANPRPVRDVEYAAMVLRGVQLEQEREQIEVELEGLVNRGAKGSRSEQLEAMLLENMTKRLSLNQSSIYIGSETGRALAIRQMGVNRETFDPVRILRSATLRKGEKLTEEEAQYFQGAAEGMQKINKDVAEGMEKAREFAGAKAKRRAETIARKITLVKSKKEEVLREREIIKKALRESGFDFSLNPGAKDLWNFGLYAKNLIQEFGLTVEEAALKTIAAFPGWVLDPIDVYHGIVMQDPTKAQKQRQKKQLTEAQKHLRLQVRKAKLLTEIDKLTRGVVTRSRTVEVKKTDPGLAALQKQLRDLRKVYFTEPPSMSNESWNEATEQIDMMLQQLEDYTLGEPISFDNVMSVMSELKRAVRAQEEIDSLRQSIADIKAGKPVTRDDVFPPRQTAEQSPSLKKLLKRRSQLSAELRRHFEDVKPKSLGEKAVWWLRGVNGFARMAKASLDLSATFLQGGFLLFRHPIVGAQAFGTSVLAGVTAFVGGSPEAFMYALTSDDVRMGLYKSVGLELTELHGGLLQSEEMFNSQLVERWRNHPNTYVKRAGIILTQHMEASSAAMTAFLNYQRVGIFEAWYAAHHTHPDFTEQDARFAATFINSATGRGLVTNTNLQLAVDIFFAPKWYKSRFDLINPWFYKTHTTKQTTGLIASSAASFMLSRMAMTYLIAAGASAVGIDVSVGLDPREADWGKLVFGKTRVDIWAGMQQMTRIAAAGFYGLGDVLGFYDLPPARAVDYRAEVGRFLSYKTAPLPAAMLSAVSGKSAVGEPRTFYGPLSQNIILQDLLLPIPVQDLYNAGKELGLAGTAASTAVSALGIPTGTYGTILDAPDVQRMLASAANPKRGTEGYNPGPPTYPIRVRQDKNLKRELDTLFGDNLGQRIKDNEQYLKELNPYGRDKVLRKYAEIERKRVIGPMVKRLQEKGQ